MVQIYIGMCNIKCLKDRVFTADIQNSLCKKQSGSVLAFSVTCEHDMFYTDELF